MRSTTTYDAVGQVSERMDGAGRRTAYAYDAAGRLTTATDPAAATTTTYYDAAGQPTLEIDPAGHTTLQEYDAAGRPVTTTNALDGASVVVYDSLGRRAATVDALGNRKTYSYSPTGRLLAATDPAGSVTRYAYDALGRTTVVTNTRGYATHTVYDALGRAAQVTDALSGTVRTSYDILGRKTAQEDADGHRTTFAYDAAGRQVRTTDAAQRGTAVTYDAGGNRLSASLCAADGTCQVQTTYTYDGLGRVASEIDALGDTTLYAYDAVGNRVARTDANGVVARYTYDAADRLASVTENEVAGRAADNQTNAQTRYGYDLLGNRTAITNALGARTGMGYDALSRLTVEADPLGHTTYYAYDAVGNRTVITDANGAATRMQYDALGRPLVLDYAADGTTVRYAYDGAGNRTAMTDTHGTTRYVYDALDRPLSISSPLTGTVDYRYDAAGNRTHLLYPTGQVVTYTYDAANRLTSVVDWAGQTTGYAYDPVGRLMTTTLPNGVASVSAYDAAGRLVGLTQRKEAEIQARFGYELDGVGNRVAVTETVMTPPWQAAQAGGAGQAGLLDAERSSSGPMTADLLRQDDQPPSASPAAASTLAVPAGRSAGLNAPSRRALQRPWPSLAASAAAGPLAAPQPPRPSAPLYANAPFTVTWAAASGDGLTSCKVQYRDGPEGIWTDWQTCLNAGSALFSGTGGHSYTFRSVAVDSSGRAYSAGVTTIVDTIIPTGGRPVVPPEPHAPFTVTWPAASDSGGSGLASCTVQVRTDGGSWAAWQDCSAAGAARYSPAGAAHTYDFRNVARDNAGNRWTSALSSAAYTAVQADSLLYASGSFTVTWPAASDPGGSGIAACAVQSQTDGGIWANWQDCQAGGSAVFAAQGTSHAYAFRTIARDVVGNVSTSTLRLVLFDGVAPSVVISEPVDGQSYATVPGFHGMAGDIGGSDLAVVQARLERSDRRSWNGQAWVDPTAWITATGASAWSCPSCVESITAKDAYTLTVRARDRAGNTASATAAFVYEVLPRPITTTIRYSYDGLDRLIDASYADGRRFQYMYDAVGNRTTATRTITSTAVSTYTYDAANRLTAVDGQAYTWDANGNLLSDGAKSYTYDPANRLVAVSGPGLAWQAVYDGDGVRIGQVTNGQALTYTLDLAAPLVIMLAQAGGDGQQLYLYGLGDSPLAADQGGTWRYLSGRDVLNSVRQETDAAGQVLVVRAFDPYGGVLVGDGGQPFGYTGEPSDGVSGLVFLRARYLSPILGGFLTLDPLTWDLGLPGIAKRYAYGDNNPLRYIDPSGHFAILPILASGAVGAAIGGGIVYGDALIHTIQAENGLSLQRAVDVFEENRDDIVKGAVVGGVTGLTMGLGTEVLGTYLATLGMTSNGVALMQLLGSGPLGGAANVVGKTVGEAASVEANSLLRRQDADAYRFARSVKTRASQPSHVAACFFSGAAGAYAGAVAGELFSGVTFTQIPTSPVPALPEQFWVQDPLRQTMKILGIEWIGQRAEGYFCDRLRGCQTDTLSSAGH